MPCYHPFVGIDTGELTKNGKRKLRIVKVDNKDDYKRMIEAGCVLVPCGKCIGCRLDYSRRWADRMILELESSKKAIFITLTYNNESCPWSMFDENNNPLFGTLDKRDCQLFMKRLRKSFSDVKIRFYLAGEYGEHTLRPHYHAIIYGIGLDDLEDLRLFGRNELGQAYYISEKISKIWNLGNVLLADVSWQTCAYVARYVTKKLNGDKDISYAKRNVCKEFSLMSRKPGIGASYLIEHPDCLDYQYINIATSSGGVKISIPNYYLRILELTDKKKFDKIKEDRKRFVSDKLLLKLNQTDLGLAEYLNVCEENKKAQTKILKRKV